MDSEVFGGNTWIFDGEVVAADDPTDFDDGGSGFELVGFAVTWTGEDLKCERWSLLLFFHFSERVSLEGRIEVMSICPTTRFSF